MSNENKLHPIMLYSAIILITLRQKRLGTVRNMYWDEDDRLSVLTDDGMMNRYTYDATLTIKR